jgi:hypothetical protein
LTKGTAELSFRQWDGRGYVHRGMRGLHESTNARSIWQAEIAARCKSDPTMSRPLELQVIEQARALIATPWTWTQGEFARDEAGNPVCWRSPQAVQFCLWGALNRAAYAVTGDRRKAVTLADRAAAAMRQPGMSLSRTNDNGGHDDVLALFDAYLTKRAA